MPVRADAHSNHAQRDIADISTARNSSPSSTPSNGIRGRQAIDDTPTGSASAPMGSAQRGLGIYVAGDTSAQQSSSPRVPAGSKSPGKLRSNEGPKVPIVNIYPGDQVERDREGNATTSHSASRLLGFSHLSDDDLSGTAARQKWPKDEPLRGCPSRRNIYHPRLDWLSLTILFLSIFSTAFSGIYLILALVEPRYGPRIRSKGAMRPETASTLVQLFAKLIELSFVTVFVSVLGQVLSRRAFVKNSKGMTLAELTMRSWIIQPGTLITHCESLRYAAFTFLGMIALTVTFVSMFYTTAADALVAPKLRYNTPEDRVLFGQVSARYANAEYIRSKCSIPITPQLERERLPWPPPDENFTNVVAGDTCLQVRHSGQSFSDYTLYSRNWSFRTDSPTDLRNRPQAPSMLYSNTSVLGSWIDVRDFGDTSSSFGRRTHNVSMAMPHPGVVSAAHFPKNKIMQPEDLAGFGEYEIRASVPSPAINVICAGLTQGELDPFLEEPAGQNINHTTSAVDDVFDFGQGKGRRIPKFPKAPIFYNTVANRSDASEGSMYVLGLAPLASPGKNLTHPFELCSLRSFLSPNCSTRYQSSLSGGKLQAVCEQPNDAMAYNRRKSDAPFGFVQNDWLSIGGEWANALSLKAGISDGNASSARLFTYLIPTAEEPYTLDPKAPSSAEMLAVLAGSTLLLSAVDTPYVHYWDAPNPLLDQPRIEGFNATIKSLEYSSGGNGENWQKVFLVVLFSVFATNLFCLVYPFVRHGQVTDFTEPQNLFALAINSPPSQRLAGSCGGGPEKKDYAVNWFIKVDSGDHVYIDDERGEPGRYQSGPNQTPQFDVEGSPLMRSYVQLSGKSQSTL